MNSQATINIQKQVKKQYQKVTQEKQQKLIELVFQKGYKIKEAAQGIDLKYGSAKNIVKIYRRTVIQKRVENQDEAKRCSYKSLNSEKRAIEVLSYQCGELLKYQKSQNQ